MNFLKTSLKCGVLSSNLLNCNAMEINSCDIAEYKINDDDYIRKIKSLEEGYKCSEFRYIKGTEQVSTLNIKFINDYIKIINLETKIDYRRQGLATKLLLCMFNAESKLNNGITELSDIYLDSTAAGYILYKKLGFKDIGGKDVMGLQPMVLKWNSDERRRCLTVNENNEIVKINNINNNNGNNNGKDDISDLL